MSLLLIGIQVIVILTYGKVCSTSLRSMLAAHLPEHVFYSHGLQQQTTVAIEKFAASQAIAPTDLLNAFADNPAILAGLGQAAANGDDVTLLCGVRDPIARSLSVAIQMLDSLFADCRTGGPEETADRLATRIAHLWTTHGDANDASEQMARAAIQSPLGWLAQEIEQPFGFDLLAEPFDLARGYRIYTNGKIRLLVYRVENGSLSIENGVEALFGQSFTLPLANVSADKPDGAIYFELKKRFRLPANALEEIYDAPYVRAFFTEDEIAAAKLRWTTLEERAPTTVATKGTRFRATVAMSILNHSAWVGDQLRSLFRQWRPDIDLVIMDDGSTDGSFEVVRNTLAMHPHIAVTLVRNERPLGHGVIPRLLRYTDSPIIVQADSDDLSLPGRIGAIMDCFAGDPQCRLVTSNALQISAEGVPLNLLDVHHDDGVFSDPMEAASQVGDIRWVGASAAFHRSLLENFPLDPAICPYGLDLLLALRATLTGTHHYLAEPLIAWRQHAGNSHRLAGVYSVDAIVQEKYRSLELMALAQRIRDIRHVQDISSQPHTLDPIAGRAHQIFLEQFTAWSRIRNHLSTATRSGDPQPATSTSIRVPPIATISPGESRRFGLTDPLGITAEEWNGFYPPEAEWNWTARRALLALRVPDVRGLNLRLAGLSFVGPQRVRLLVGDSAPVEVEVVDRETEVTIPIDSQSDVVPLRIEAMGAARPCDHLPDYPDTRQLGVRLFSLSAF